MNCYLNPSIAYNITLFMQPRPQGRRPVLCLVSLAQTFAIFLQMGLVAAATARASTNIQTWDARGNSGTWDARGNSGAPALHTGMKLLASALLSTAAGHMHVQ